MATTYQRKPDAKDPRSILEAIKNSPDKKIDPKLREAQEKLGKESEKKDGEKADISQDAAAQLQASLGNSAIQGLVKQGTETGTESGESTAQEAQEQAEEEQSEEDKEAESGEVERVLPSFTNAAGGGGGSPWAMGHFFGGDDDGDGESARSSQGRWRPMPSLPDPDEDIPLETGDEDGDGGEPLDFDEAEEMLGSAPWEPGLLSRGLLHPHRAAVREFSAVKLANLNRLDTAYGRARRMLQFLAAHSEGEDAALIARASAATTASERTGFSGACAYVLALCELVLRATPEPESWVPTLEAVLDVRVRPAVEEAAAMLALEGRLSAPELIAQVASELPPAADMELMEDCHPAALAALETAAMLQPLPIVDIWRPLAAASEEAEDELLQATNRMDAWFAELLGDEPVGEGISEDALQPLFDSLNTLLASLGQAQAEVACAAVATLPWGDPAQILGVAELFDSLIKKVARRLVRVGREVEALVGSTELEQVTALSAEAAAVRGSAEIVRRAAFCTLGVMLLNKTYERPVFPDVLEEAQALLAINRSLEARERLEQAIEANNGDDEAEGKLLLLLGGMLWEQGFAEAAEAHLNWAEALLQPFSPHVAAAAGLMELSILLDHAPDRVEERTQRLLLLGQQLGCPYLVAAAAIARATGVASVEPLLQAASWLREQQAGAALNLLKACWAELKTGGSA